MKGITILLSLVLGLVLMNYHKNEKAKAYIDGFEKASQKYKDDLDKCRLYYYEQGFHEGKVHEAANCQAAKRLASEQAYEQGRIKGENLTKACYEAQLQMLDHNFEDKVYKIQAEFKELLTDTLNQLRTRHEMQIQGILKTVPNDQLKLESSIQKLTWSKTLVMLVIVFATPFLVAAIQGQLLKRKRY